MLRDVRNELLSPTKAAADYGVIVDTARWVVDEAATRRALHPLLLAYQFGRIGSSAR